MFGSKTSSHFSKSTIHLMSCAFFSKKCKGAILMINKAKDILNDLLNDKYIDDTGWFKLEETTNDLIDEMNELSQGVKRKSDVFVVVGVGGSYLGSRAIIEALTNQYNKDIEIMYLGNSLSALDLEQALEYLWHNDKDFTINLISKSGTTLEPLVTFRLLRELLINKYGYDEAMNRIVITTDNKSKLKEYADKNNIKTLHISENIGGRYSVLTSAGLLPIAVAGLNIGQLIEGAKKSLSTLGDGFIVDYAAHRINSFKNGKDIEIFAYYEPRLHYLGEWIKQLFGESEGKDGKGLFPSSACFTTDLHSLGQLIQDGKRNIIETHICFDHYNGLMLKNDKDNFDNLNQFKSIQVNKMNELAGDGVRSVHIEGGVPVTNITLCKLNEFSLGYLIHMLQTTCAISGLLLGVNPFNQPGVEDYKVKVKELLEMNIE